MTKGEHKADERNWLQILLKKVALEENGIVNRHRIEKFLLSNPPDESHGAEKSVNYLMDVTLLLFI